MPPLNARSSTRAATRLGMLAAAIVLAVCAASAFLSPPGATAQSSATEVRIVARLIADGRIEFALQQREGTGWSNHMLPRARFFPVTSTVDRWLVSTPLTINAVETEVRIVARLVADSRVEFALQRREGDGWSDRMLPRARFFPATSTVDLWLVSTPLTIENLVARDRAAFTRSCRGDRVG